ncbi:phage-related minor tail family protein [Burkholderia sp. MSHR3999]|uniref:phage tail tape measure protein n=1 Tax=Burkholderia sp. MSHR3999 TaxID=1542965 RepID=UPI0005B6A848|nr:phage tail tape measure protein [Burkholderia sp. MSHR3999]KIP18709.1 phage-related minor tail family protein [Burkholderia sp. MSHR3999]
MSQNLLVSMLVRLRDELSRPASRMLQDVTRDARNATNAVSAVADASARSAQKRETDIAQSERAVQREIGRTGAAFVQQAQMAQSAGDAAVRSNDASLSKRLRDYQRFNRAWEALGIRSEAEIQREITRTEAAYARLAQSGMMSAQEQARAFAQVQTRVAELNAEMGRLSARERGIQLLQSGAGKFVRAGEAVLGGIAAAHAVAAPVGRTMDFDRNIALMANTAFNEEDAPARIRGMQELRNVVRESIRAGGGTPDEIAAAMTQLLGQNAITHEQAFRLMPVLQRYATAEGADTTELGDIAMRGIQTFGLKEDQIPQALDAAIMGGHMGGFHLRQMAKWLPQQMAAARNSGMGGMNGLSELIALNEVSMTTAGTADEAGNNALDLLNKLNSADTAHAVKRELGRTLGVKLANARAQGKSALVAFGEILEEVMAKDKNYQIIKKKLATAKNDGERQELYTSMEQIIEGSAISKVVRNRQEMLALMGYLNNKEKFNAIKAATLNAKGIGDKDAEVMQSTDAFKAERAKSLGEMGEMDAVRPLDKAIGKVSDVITQYGGKYPGLMTAIMGTKVAFEGLTSVMMAVGMMRFITGHGGGAVEREMAKDGVAAAARAAGGRGGLLARALKPAGSSALSLLFGGIEAYGVSQDESLSASQKKSEYARVAGGTAGGIGGWMAGAAAGAAIGSVVPVVGTALGGAVGGLVGGFGGDLLGEKLGKLIGDALFKAESNKQAQPINITTKVQMDGHVVAEAVNQINAQAALRH